MKRKKCIWLLWALAGCCMAAGTSAQIAGQVRGKYVIPFRLSPSNTIIVRVVLNGLDTVALAFHTASGDVTLTDSAVQGMRSIRWDGKVDSVKSWGGGNNESSYSRRNSLEMAGLRRKDVLIWKDLRSGEGTGGKIGLHFFAGSVVEMDFDRDRIVIGGKLPRKVKKYVRLPIVAKDDLLFLPAGVILGGDTLDHDYLLHSGYSGDVLLDDAFVTGSGIDGKLAVVGEKKLTDAFGHVIVTEKVLLPMFRIGGRALTNVPAGYFQGGIGRQKMSVVGCDVLKRWNWIVDAERKYIYLKPSRHFSDAYPKG